MTKRFEFREVNELAMLPKVYDTERQEYANLFECVGWLNEQHETIEQLKQQLNELKNITPINKKRDEIWEKIPKQWRS